MAMKEPLPCPFCGMLPVVEPWAGKDRISVVIYCKFEFCFATPSVIAKTKETAMEYWNTRDGMAR